MAGPRSANRRRLVLALVVLTSLTLITLDSRNGRTGPLGSVGRLVHTILSPLEHATSAVARPIGDWWSGVIDSGSLKRQNRALRAEIATLQGRQQDAAAAIQQDQFLKGLLGLRLLSSAHQITARVINRDPGNFQSTITLDRGQEVGIEKDMAVVAPNGIVGHVISSWRGGAEVRVLTDPESAIAVRTTTHPAIGIAQGREGSDDLVVSDFDAATLVRKGDAVVSAAVSNSVFPPDLSVGTVSSVEVQPAGLGLVVHIKPYVDFDALEFVDVLRWVPGEGPVVAPTTTTAPPGGGSGPTTTTTTFATTTTFGSTTFTTTTTTGGATSSSVPTAGSGR